MSLVCLTTCIEEEIKRILLLMFRFRVSQIGPTFKENKYNGRGYFNITFSY